MKLSISEILEKASKIENEQERVFFLRQNDSTTLRSVFQGAYDPRIVWALPEGDPPYKPNNLVDQQHRLYTETRKFYLFIEGGNPNLKPNFYNNFETKLSIIKYSYIAFNYSHSKSDNFLIIFLI